MFIETSINWTTQSISYLIQTTIYFLIIIYSYAQSYTRERDRGSVESIVIIKVHARQSPWLDREARRPSGERWRRRAHSRMGCSCRVWRASAFDRCLKARGTASWALNPATRAPQEPPLVSTVCSHSKAAGHLHIVLLEERKSRLYYEASRAAIERCTVHISMIWEYIPYFITSECEQCMCVCVWMQVLVVTFCLSDIALEC